MKSAKNSTIAQNKNIIRILLVTAFILLIPLIAMQFSDEVDWKLADFIIIGTLLIGAGLAYEFIAKKVRNKNHRVILGIALMLALLIVWAEIAVGVFGSPFAGS